MSPHAPARSPARTPAANAPSPPAFVPVRPGLVYEGVSHRYGAVRALDSVDLAVRRGETVCLLGPSGCGKSTLLRLAAGLETLQSGRIAIEGQVVAAGGPGGPGRPGGGRPLPPEARGVGLMFQDYALFPHLTVAENVCYGLAGSRAQRAARARRALVELDMDGLAGRYPHQLSGGQQQRVALLRALAPRPRVMLLDEPFSTLDEHLRHEVRTETLRLIAATGAATVIVTHDAEEALLLGDRIVVMRDGRIAQDGSPEEVYARPADLFTARLFGPVNRYRGTVRWGVVATPFGMIAAPGRREGLRVDVVIRMEGIELQEASPATAASRRPAHGPAAPPPHGGPVRARVRSVRRLGAWTLVVLVPIDAPPEARVPAPEEGGGRRDPPAIDVRLPGVVSFPVGGVHTLRFDSEHTFVFPARS